MYSEVVQQVYEEIRKDEIRKNIELLQHCKFKIDENKNSQSEAFYAKMLDEYVLIYHKDIYSKPHKEFKKFLKEEIYNTLVKLDKRYPLLSLKRIRLPF
jgi:hypothetical protein